MLKIHKSNHGVFSKDTTWTYELIQEYGQSQIFDLCSKTSNSLTSKQTKDFDKPNYVSDLEAINPNQPSTFKKTQQVHDTSFNLKVISWHFEHNFT